MFAKPHMPLGPPSSPARKHRREDEEYEPPAKRFKAETRFFIGVDVGTGSARAGVFSENGDMLTHASVNIKMWNPEHDHYEQSSEDIWLAVCAAIKKAVDESGVSPSSVHGMGVDATCSLVALDENFLPVSLSNTGHDEQNIIVWMDHRAVAQAKVINETGHDVLQYVGGIISPEMETPKILWVKQHLPASYARVAHWFDLADYIVHRATSSTARSLCTTVCKWTYLGHQNGTGWDASYFNAIGLEDIAEANFVQIGTDVRPMGEPALNGLTEAAAEATGLARGTAVSIGIIDAHAGALGMLGAQLGGEQNADGEVTSNPHLHQRLAMVCGTSTCHLAVNEHSHLVPGVWGPYFGALISGMWLTEGGQSATGALLDHIVHTHPKYAEVSFQATAQGTTVINILNERVNELTAKNRLPFSACLTQDLHVYPDFHGNRSPIADPTLKGMVSGLTLTHTFDDFALIYYATLQAVCYGTRHIIETMNKHGHELTTVLASGGLAKNWLFLQELADIIQTTVVEAGVSEPVLAGAAVLGAVASGLYRTVPEAMQAMNRAGNVRSPSKLPQLRAYHGAKYAVYHAMLENQREYRIAMQNWSESTV